MRKQRHDIENVSFCPMECTLDVMGGKWKSVILYRLLDGPKRFGELGRLLCNITQRTLTQQLRELEADGLVIRTVYPEVPPRVDYRLSALGLSLEPILTSLLEWGRAYLVAPQQASMKVQDGARL